MAIMKMRLINIIGEQSNLDEVLIRFCALNKFHPEPASKFIGSVKGLRTFEGTNPYSAPLQKLKELAAQMDIPLNAHASEKIKLDLATIEHSLNAIQERYELSRESKQELEKVIQEDYDAIKQMDNLENLGISLDEIFACKYLQVRFGRLPVDSIEKLSYYDNKPFVFKSFNSDEVYSWCMYVTTPKYAMEVDNIFSSLYFERIRIPDFVHGTPTKAKENMYRDIEENNQLLQHVDDVLNKVISESRIKFNDIYSDLIKFDSLFEARKYVVCLGERFSITGFAGEKDVELVKEAFKGIKGVEVEDLPANSDKRLTPPTKLKNGWLTRPFSFFVEMYSLPNYYDFDPTTFFGLTYLILFGAMFGDVGQGLVLALVGLFASKKLHMRLGDIGVRVGLVSMIFGVVYGSVFGFEHALNPLYHAVLGISGKPIDVMEPSFTMQLLISAVGLGMILIITSMGLNIWTKLHNQQYIEAICSQNGVCGLVFYSALLLMVVNSKLINPYYIGLLVVIPFIGILAKGALLNYQNEQCFFPEGVGGYIVENIFEGFEVLLTFLANTMSFLRIGGFVLAHTGMMMVVMTISEMLNPIGSVLVIIFGNILVMALEGLIVGIQSLRLEFYEMFSRYYDGQGVAFKPFEYQLEY